MDFPPITLIERIIEMVSDPYFWLTVVIVAAVGMVLVGALEEQ